jgi:hypothetical protein
MAINATNNGTKRELIPAGNYVARCYQMIEIGTINEFIQGQNKQLTKVRIGWELPTELKVFKEENGEQPLVISEEFTLSMNEKSNLRKTLASWRGKDFTEDEAKCFDITVLVGIPCFLNIIHKPSKSDPSKTYEKIGGISPLPKGFAPPPAILKPFVLSYDNFSEEKFDLLPDFIKTKMQGSLEYAAMKTPNSKHMNQGDDINSGDGDDLPF